KFRYRIEREARNQKRDEPLQRTASIVETDMHAALNDDLNAPRAIAALFDFVRVANRELDQGAGGANFALQMFDRIMKVFDLLPTQRAVDPALERWIEERIAVRDKARKSKDFKAADVIRGELSARGIEIEDTPLGTKWRMR